MSDCNDHCVGNDEDQEQQREVCEKMLDEILDEVMKKYGDTLRRLGES